MNSHKFKDRDPEEIAYEFLAKAPIDKSHAYDRVNALLGELRKSESDYTEQYNHLQRVHHEISNIDISISSEVAKKDKEIELIELARKEESKCISELSDFVQNEIVPTNPVLYVGQLHTIDKAIKHRINELSQDNVELVAILKELHKKCLYQIHPDDDRVTHVEYGMFKKVESVLLKHDK